MKVEESSPERVSIESIENELRTAVINGIPMAPSVWLDRVSKINILMQDLDEKCVLAEFEVNRGVAELVEAGQSAAAARALVRGSLKWVEHMNQKLKRERLQELIRIAKRRVDLQEWDS